MKHEVLAPGIEIYQGDCRDIILDLPELDLVVTSPPYNTGVEYDNHDDNMKLSNYKSLALSVMNYIGQRLKVGGRACIEVGGSGRDFPLGFIWQDAAYYKNDLGLHSHIGMAHRKTNPCAWGSYMKADACYTIPNFHEMFVFYKETGRKEGGETTITKKEWMEWTKGWWQINWSVGSDKSHPAQFPIELPTRCLRLFGHKNDLVLDPFMGSGTTAKACWNQERRFIGIEKSEKYYELAKTNILKHIMQMRLF